MPSNKQYQPEYDSSHALVIGINNYKNASPLEFARNDAEAFSSIIKTNFGFPEKNITLLIDDQATRGNIHRAFSNFAGSKTEDNDRLLFYFAGHGVTLDGSRGEVGCLVPYDGDISQLSSLIRWKELANTAELIHAKHVFFIMDACYGGLAITRLLHPGSMRFLKDMLKRYSRQALTAGKGDEVVADAGGPREGHSIFTGHLLDALDGAAATSDDVLTANSVMSYVYDKVAKDYNSNQSPHYGHLDGDGDFLFNHDIISTIPEDEEKDTDLLIKLPVSKEINENNGMEKIQKFKEYLSDSKYRIKLDDLLNEEIMKVLQETSEDKFPTDSKNVTHDLITERLSSYEKIVGDLNKMVILLARWGGNEHIPMLDKVFSRLADNVENSRGKMVLLGLRWYPCHYLMYSAGIAALSADNFNNLYKVFNTKIGAKLIGNKSKKVLTVTHDEIKKLHRADIFQKIPGYEKKYVARSEYLFKELQPTLDDLLFLGRSYEQLFDEFEIFMALEHANQNYEDGHFWIPPGRYSYKYRSGGVTSNPYKEVLDEAENKKEKWEPLRCGLFNQSYERFKELYEKGLESIKNLHWY